MSAACPFCGDEREPSIGVDAEEPPGYYYAECLCCSARGPSTPKEKSDAITLWNNREARGSSEPWRKQFEKIL